MLGPHGSTLAGRHPPASWPGEAHTSSTSSHVHTEHHDMHHHQHFLQQPPPCGADLAYPTAACQFGAQQADGVGWTPINNTATHWNHHQHNYEEAAEDEEPSTGLLASEWSRTVQRNKRSPSPLWHCLLSVLVGLTVIAVVLATWSLASSAPHAPVVEREVKDWTLVVYVYWERDAIYAENLRYFLRVGVGSEEESRRSRVEYLLIVQGARISVAVPSHVKVLMRPNTCYDYGAIGDALRTLSLPTYRHYVVINTSVKGPYLPAYWPSSVHWSLVFTSRINEHVKLVGTSVVCLPENDLGGWGPRVEGFAWATDFVGLELGMRRGVFECYDTKEDVILFGEYGMSEAVLDAGYTFDTLQLKYQGVDWRDPANWKCNNRRHPTRANAYEGINMHPLETVFHKRNWTDHPVEVLPEYLDRYSRWKYDELDRTGGRRRNNFDILAFLRGFVVSHE